MNETASRAQSMRSNRLLRRKFSQYLLPTMITYAALSLNEFADSIETEYILGMNSTRITIGGKTE